jgi:NitT/TauT family transport system substrate-binding protein
MGIRRVPGMTLLVTAVAMALAAGCSSGGGAADASRAEKPVLSVAVVPAVDSAGFFVALDQGLFKAQGLTVNFIPVTSSESAIAGQVAGTYDITGGNYVSYIQAQQRGQANLYIFAEGSVMEPGTQGIYAMPGSPVTTLAGLKGQTVAINAPDNILYLLTASVLAEHGVSPQSVTFASIPFPRCPSNSSPAPSARP